jgi:hypothetical protein
MVIVKAADMSRHLAVADVVKPCKAGSRDTLYLVVRYQKVLFPPHKNNIFAPVVIRPRVIVVAIGTL